MKFLALPANPAGRVTYINPEDISEISTGGNSTESSIDHSMCTILMKTKERHHINLSCQEVLNLIGVGVISSISSSQDHSSESPKKQLTLASHFRESDVPHDLKDSPQGKGLYEYLQHMENSKYSLESVHEFFEYMRDNQEYELVSEGNATMTFFDFSTEKQVIGWSDLTSTDMSEILTGSFGVNDPSNISFMLSFYDSRESIDIITLNLRIRSKSSARHVKQVVLGASNAPRDYTLSKRATDMFETYLGFSHQQSYSPKSLARVVDLTHDSDEYELVSDRGVPMDSYSFSNHFGLKVRWKDGNETTFVGDHFGDYTNDKWGIILTLHPLGQSTSSLVLNFRTKY